MAAVAPARRRMRGVGSSYLVLVVGLLLTTGVSLTFIRSAREKEHLRLQNLAAEIENRVSSRFSRHVTSLLGGAALFAVDARVSMSEFRNFTQRLMRFGGLTGMQAYGFSRRVTPDDLESYEYAVRRDLPGFRIWPQGERKEYFAIEYLEPQSWRNLRAIGYDMFTNAVRREAMERARDTGEPAATAPVKLVQETDTSVQQGFLIYVPAYRRGRLPNTVEERRENLIGFVYSPYRSKDFLDATLLRSDWERFAVSLYAGASVDPARALYEAPFTGTPAMTATRTFSVAGRDFTLRMLAWPRVASTARWGGTLVGAMLGLLVTVLLFTLTRFQVAARLAAEQNAERLRQARTEAVRNLRTRDAFLSIASHELKTPLTALQLQVDGLHRAFSRDQNVEPERVHRRLESVRRQTRRLTSLVDDLLDVSRLANGRLNLVGQQVDLRSLLSEVVARFETEAQRLSSPIALHFGAGNLEGHWDPTRLDQVLTNLISNALKYGAGHPIEIRAERQEDDVVFEVRDHGIGIAAADQQRIFSRFERAVPDRNFGGFGLGLWICRELVGAMGGSISVASSEGQGATFRVALPVGSEKAPAAVARAG